MGLRTTNVGEGEAVWGRERNLWDSLTTPTATFYKIFGLLFRWYRSWVAIGPTYIVFLYQHSFTRNFRFQFWVGAANPKICGWGGHRGSGMVPFERALVSSCRPSILTFPLSLRVSEILSFLFSSMPLFPIPPIVSSKFAHVPVGVGASPFGFKKRRYCANCPCD